MNLKNFSSLLPPQTAAILDALTEAGYEAYLVGGAVRDLLLGLQPEDYDITTNAHPEQVLEVCRRRNWHTVDKLGQNWGCVIILLDGMATEVTSFRGERYDDQDVHRPAATWYCQTLQEDLSRRDFTVNAMALDKNGRLYDYFGGQQDLEKKLLRTVGDPAKRYGEDALRMLRACRFVAQLGFIYTQDTGLLPPCGQEGTPYYLPHAFAFPTERCSRLSLERVRRELEKLLLSPHAGQGLMLMMATGLLGSSCRSRSMGRDTEIPLLPEALHLLGLPQNPRFHIYDTWEHTLLAVDNSPRQLAIRWALVLHDLGKGLTEIRKIKNGQPTDPGHEAQSAIMAQAILTRLGYGEDFVRLVVWLVAQHMRFAPMLITGERTLLRWVRAEATSGTFRNQQELAEAYELLTEVFLADMGATHARENLQLMQEGRTLGEQVVELARTRMPVCAKDLALGGKELLTLVPQAEIKNTLSYLLERVQSGNLPNEAAALRAALLKNREKQAKIKKALQIQADEKGN